MGPMKSGLWLLVLVLLAMGASGIDLYAQQFPYSVPQAPEFNPSGESVAPTPARRPAQTRPHPSVSENYEQQPSVPLVSPGFPTAPRSPRGPRGPQAEAPTPYVQPERPLNSGAPQRPGPMPQPVGPASGMPGASSPPQGPTQGQPQPDCSGYPMMIANATSEGEMRAAAKEFLTCLLYSGWQIEQAKQHVISTIESTRALRRY